MPRPDMRVIARPLVGSRLGPNIRAAAMVLFGLRIAEAMRSDSESAVFNVHEHRLSWCAPRERRSTEAVQCNPSQRMIPLHRRDRFTDIPCRAYQSSRPRPATPGPECRRSRGNPLPDIPKTHPMGRTGFYPSSAGAPLRQLARPYSRQYVEPSACRTCEVGSQRRRCIQSSKPRAFLTSAEE